MNRVKLDNNEVMRLFDKLNKGDESVRKVLIEYNYPLALYFAKNCNYNLPFEDRLSLSSLALIKAVDKFDTSRGYKFSTYAIACMRNRLNRYIERELGKQPVVLFSLDEKVYNEGNNQLEIDKIPTSTYLEEDEIIENLDKNDELKNVYKALNVLKKEELIVLINTFGIGCEELSQEQISKLINKTQSTVSKKLKSGLEKIKNELKYEDCEKKLILK